MKKAAESLVHRISGDIGDFQPKPEFFKGWGDLDFIWNLSLKTALQK